MENILLNEISLLREQLKVLSEKKNKVSSYTEAQKASILKWRNENRDKWREYDRTYKMNQRHYKSECLIMRNILL